MPHTRQTENAETLAKQLTLMRTQAQQSAQASRQRAADAAKKSKHTPDFEVGQRVYKVKDALGDAEDYKTAMKFEGPFVILDRGPNNVYKLRHIYTGKVLKNYIFVDKLKSADSARAIRRKRQTITTINRQECKTCGSTDGWLTRVTQKPAPPKTRYLRRQAPTAGKRQTTGRTIPKVRLEHPEKANRNIVHERDEQRPLDNFTEFESDLTALMGTAATGKGNDNDTHGCDCLLYTSPSPRDRQKSRMPSSA